MGERNDSIPNHTSFDLIEFIIVNNLYDKIQPVYHLNPTRLTRRSALEIFAN